MLTARSRVPFPLLLHIARSRSSKEGESFLGGLDHTAVLDGWHLNPTGESDMTLKSRVTMLSHEMLESRYTAIRGLTTTGFRMVDGLFLYGPIAVFPRTVLTTEEITPDSLELFVRLEPKIDILVMGVGDRKNIDAVRRRVAPYLREHKIALEISNTEDAIPTFNFLNAERRYVAGAMYPPDDLTVTNEENRQALHRIQEGDILQDEHNVFKTASWVMPSNQRDRVRFLIKKITDGANVEELTDVVMQLAEHNKKARRGDK